MISRRSSRDSGKATAQLRPSSIFQCHVDGFFEGDWLPVLRGGNECPSSCGFEQVAIVERVNRPLDDRGHNRSLLIDHDLDRTSTAPKFVAFWRIPGRQ